MTTKKKPSEVSVVFAVHKVALGAVFPCQYDSSVIRSRTFVYQWTYV